MLRKNFIAFGLIAMTVMMVTTSHTIISIAAPTNAEASDNIMKDLTIKGIDSLEKLVKEGNYEKSNDCRNHVKLQLENLSSSREDVTDIQKKFDELSKKVDALGENKRTIEGLKQSVKDSIRNIMNLLYIKDYEPIPNMLTDLANNMDELSKHEPIDQLVLDRVENLKYRYNNRETLNQAENMVNLVKPQLDNLLSLIKEKNLSESILAKKQVTSDIKKLDDLLKVPEFIKKKFDLCYKNLDELITLKEESIALKNEINLLLNKTEKFIDIQDHKNAKEYINKALEKVNILDNLDTIDESLSKRLAYIKYKFHELSKQIDILEKNKKKIEGIRLSVEASIEDIIYLLSHKKYEPIPYMFTYLSNNMDELSKYKPIHQSILDKVENLKYRYDNRETLDKFEYMVNSIKSQLDNLSRLIKEKNLSKSILAKKRVNSDIKKLNDFLKVPKSIKNKFALCCEKLDELIPLKEEAIVLKNEIYLLLNKSDKFIDINDHKNAKEYMDKALEKVNTFNRLGVIDKPLSKRLTCIKYKFNTLEVLSSQLLSPFNDIQPANLENSFSKPSATQNIKTVDLSLMENDKNEEIKDTKLVDSNENDKNEDVKSTKLADSN